LILVQDTDLTTALTFDCLRPPPAGLQPDFVLRRLAVARLSPLLKTLPLFSHEPLAISTVEGRERERKKQRTGNYHTVIAIVHRETKPKG
jgi:hypothetical protein